MYLISIQSRVKCPAKVSGVYQIQKRKLDQGIGAQVELIPALHPHWPPVCSKANKLLRQSPTVIQFRILSIAAQSLTIQ